MFGLTNSEGNHGEDVKEYWFYLDSTPTHSYMKCLYKYPQRAFPYDDLLATNRRARQAGPGVRAARHRRLRRGPLLRRGRRVRQGRARRHPDAGHRPQPRSGGGDAARAADAVVPQHVVVGRRRGQAVARPPTAPACGARRTPSSGRGGCTSRTSARLLFCENETNNERLFGVPNTSAHPKDAIDDHVVAGAPLDATQGTKAAAHHVLEIPAGASATRSGCAPDGPRHGRPRSGPTSSGSFAARRTEADAFYATVIPPALDADQRAGHAPGAGRAAVVQAVLRVRRAPLAARARRQPVGPGRGESRCATPAGSTWSPATSSRCPTSGSTRGSRPGTWPSTARPLSLVDVDFAKEQVELLLRTRYMHPNGADPGLRVELLRRQPARARVGGAARLRARGRDPRRRRPGVPAARLPAPAHATSAGGSTARTPTGATSSRAASSGSTTSASSTARRRCPGGGTLRPGGRHRLDGAVLPVDAADRDRARARGHPTTSTWR